MPNSRRIRRIGVKLHLIHLTKSICLLAKPDIPPDRILRVPMKNLILAAFAALSLITAIGPVRLRDEVLQ
jgi:hypothetical protein